MARLSSYDRMMAEIEADPEYQRRLAQRMAEIDERQRMQSWAADRVRAAGFDPAEGRGRKLLEKIERTDGDLCLARTRRGTLCIALGSGNGWRCRLHGGASSGPKTDEGRARALANLVQNRPK